MQEKVEELVFSMTYSTNEAYAKKYKSQNGESTNSALGVFILHFTFWTCVAAFIYAFSMWYHYFHIFLNNIFEVMPPKIKIKIIFFYGSGCSIKSAMGSFVL